MEILNNIWSALTTENELLIKIICFPFIFIENLLSFLLFTNILKIKYEKKQKYIYVLLTTIIPIICNLCIPEPYSVFINYMFIFLIIKKLFKFNIIKTVLSIIFPFAIFGLVNSLMLNPFLKIFNVSYESCFSTPIYRISYVFFMYSIIFLLLFIFKKINFKYTFRIHFDKKIIHTVLINLILGIITLVIQAILNFYYINSIPIIFTLFNFLLLFAYFFISFYSLAKALKLDIATRDLENAESYNNSLTVLYDNVRGFKHDFDNMINIISGYIQVDDMDGLKKYFSSFERDCRDVSNVQMLNPKIINNPGIYNLIVSKYKKATDLGVIIDFEFFFDFTNLKMPVYEFSKILGILLDNAIESATECKEKKLNLIFRDSQIQKVQIISIENTYFNKNLDTSKIFEKGFSSKENHTGIGLWEINKIIKKFNNIVLKTSKNESLFKQELQINY